MNNKILREIVRVLWPPAAVLCFFLGFTLGYKGCSETQLRSYMEGAAEPPQ